MSRYTRLLLIMMLFQVNALFGGGIRLTELGTADVGVAGAGSAAVARDAGTVYFNPAGMTRFDCNQLVFGGDLMIADIRFDTSSKTIFQGGNGGQSGAILPLLGAYYIHSLCDSVKLGFCVNMPYGGMFNYGKTWKGRYLIQREFLPVIAMNPTIAYKVNSCFSVGAGFTAEFAYLQEAFALNPIVFGGTPVVDPDGRLELNMESWTFGYNFGVLYEFSPCTRFGVSYRSQLRHKFLGRGTITGPVLITLGIDTEITFAQFVIASVYQQLTNRLAILGNVGWEDWSAMDRTVLTSDNGGSFTIPRNWQDTWHAAIGAEYRLCRPLLLQAGFAYDSSPTRAHDRTPDLPMDRQLRFGTGLIYEWNKHEKTSLSLEYLNGGKAPINLIKEGTDITLLKGHYSHNQIIFININYIRKF